MQIPNGPVWEARSHLSIASSQEQTGAPNTVRFAIPLHQLRLVRQGTRSAAAGTLPRAAAVGFGSPSKKTWGAFGAVKIAGAGQEAAAEEETAVSLPPEVDSPVSAVVGSEAGHSTVVVGPAVVACTTGHTLAVAAGCRLVPFAAIAPGCAAEDKPVAGPGMTGVVVAHEGPDRDLFAALVR